MIANRNLLVWQDYYAKWQEIKKNDKNFKELNDAWFVDWVEEVKTKAEIKAEEEAELLAQLEKEEAEAKAKAKAETK